MPHTFCPLDLPVVNFDVGFQFPFARPIRIEKGAAPRRHVSRPKTAESFFRGCFAGFARGFTRAIVSTTQHRRNSLVDFEGAAVEKEHLASRVDYPFDDRIDCVIQRRGPSAGVR